MFRQIENCATKVAAILNDKVYDDEQSIKYIDSEHNLLDNKKVARKSSTKNKESITQEDTSDNIFKPSESIAGVNHNSQKVAQEEMSKLFVCVLCNYETTRRYNYNKHTKSDTHINAENIEIKRKIGQLSFNCYHCNYTTIRKHDYEKHFYTKKHIIKTQKTQKENIQTFLEKQDMKIDSIKEEITSIIINEFKNMSHNNTTINNNKISNQQFNMNVFLNETCKDAMNMSEFIENLQVSMEDMEKTGELGFAKGMSRIIMNNLNAIDICKRPIHCSDVKRETLYIKNNGVWEKETEDRKRTKEVIYKISCLNVKQLLKWRDLPRNKGYEKSDHTKNDEFTKLVMEIHKLREEEIDKVITNISKYVAIDKEKVKMSGYLD